jgi:hypothetical protein
MTQKPSSAPAAPTTLEETGLSTGQIEQLLVKTLHDGELTGLALADRMRLPYALLEPLIERLRAERLVEVRGAASTGASSYRYALTDGGRDRAQQYFEISRYVGAAPVPLATYTAYMTALSAARGYMDRERLTKGFSHLIISEKVLEQLGPAVNAGKAIFLYGAPGNGKTVIAEGLGRTIGGDMHVPYAIDVDGQIMTMYDPITHHAIEAEPAAASVISPKAEDRRWIRISRPVVMVGGELTLDMLDLRFNALSKFYEAPIQLKANGGVFLVDDFGRQRTRPQDLLNRWIVPLESRIDFLTLHTGKKFQVPFDVLTVFATNLNPESLADEAFLRRIPYKIPIIDPSVDEFTRIFELNCRKRKLRFHRVMVAYLHRRHYSPVGRALRACHPRDLLDQVAALCRYRGIEPAITRELLDAACASYFISTAPAAPPVIAHPRQGPSKRLEVH